MPTDFVRDPNEKFVLSVNSSLSLSVPGMSCSKVINFEPSRSLVFIIFNYLKPILTTFIKFGGYTYKSKDCSNFFHSHPK